MTKPTRADAGAAYLFPVDPTGADPTPYPIATFWNPDADEDDWFGWSVCGAGDDIVIGAPGEDDTAGTDVGVAYHYDWLPAQQRYGTVVEVTVPGLGTPGDLFGWSVAMLDDQFLVTGPRGRRGCYDDAVRQSLFVRP